MAVKVKMKGKLKHKGDFFIPLESLQNNASTCHMVGLMLGATLIGIILISFFIAH